MHARRPLLVFSAATFLLFFVFIFLTFLPAYQTCYQTNLLPGEYLKDGPSVLRANTWSVPLAYDWDGDGKKDLLVGNRGSDEQNRSSGYVSFFRNTGTDEAPAFNGSTYVQTCGNVCSPLTGPAVG